MAYQQFLPYNTSSKQLHDHQVASHTGPPPRGPEQRVSGPSERRLDPMQGYQYQNRVQGTYGYGKQDNGLKDYSLANSSNGQELGHPTSYRPAQSDAQVKYHGRQPGPERAIGGNAEAWGQAPGRGRYEGGGLWPDVRPMKSQNHEPAVRARTQSKPRKSVWIPRFATHP